MLRRKSRQWSGNYITNRTDSISAPGNIIALCRIVSRPYVGDRHQSLPIALVPTLPTPHWSSDEEKVPSTGGCYTCMSEILWHRVQSD